jgi:uncharacterized membrane protein YccC
VLGIEREVNCAYVFEVLCVSKDLLVLAAFTLLFAWLSYGALNVNYSLFSVFITGYIVFLLSLADVPGPVIAQRGALCTALGGSIALIVRLVVISRRMSLWKRAAAAVHQRV